MLGQVKTYDELMAQSSNISKVVTPDIAEAVFKTNEHTIKNLGDTWRANNTTNLPLLDKHGTLFESFRGFGTNKAIIGIGAGPSFNKNKDILKEVYAFNLRFSLDQQPFIFVAANKMFKPLLEMGMAPHFVLLVDAGDALYSQLCEGIPDGAKDTFLITGLHTSPKVLNGWDKQGGNILFYLIGDDEEKEKFEKRTKLDPEPYHINQGGNVLNTLWVLANRVFGSKIYITVGNDLSYPFNKDKEERKNLFYGVGDYYTNVLNKRDEADFQVPWMAFDLYKNEIVNRYMYNLKLSGTSRQMWTYKIWLEVQATIWAEKLDFKIYNASESGILGVLAKSHNPEDIEKKDNWFLMDEVLPKHWKTTTLRTACGRFLEAKACLETHTATNGGASGVIHLPEKTDIVNGIAPHVLK